MTFLQWVLAKFKKNSWSTDENYEENRLFLEIEQEKAEICDKKDPKEDKKVIIIDL